MTDLHSRTRDWAKSWKELYKYGDHYLSDAVYTGTERKLRTFHVIIFAVWVAFVWLSWIANQGRGTIRPFSLFTRDLGGVEVAFVAAFSLSKRRASRSASCSGVGVNVPGIEADKNDI
jgi:hypothetical protein